MNQFLTMTSNITSMKNKVCIIGSGNWGSAIALAVGANTAAHPEIFERQVTSLAVSPCRLGHSLRGAANVMK